MNEDDETSVGSIATGTVDHGTGSRPGRLPAYRHGGGRSDGCLLPAGGQLPGGEPEGSGRAGDDDDGSGAEGTGGSRHRPVRRRSRGDGGRRPPPDVEKCCAGAGEHPPFSGIPKGRTRLSGGGRRDMRGGCDGEQIHLFAGGHRWHAWKTPPPGGHTVEGRWTIGSFTFWHVFI